MKSIRTIDQLSAKEIEDCACIDLEKYFLDVATIKEIAKRSIIKETGYIDLLLFSERFTDSREHSLAIRTDKEKALLDKITQGVANIMDNYANELNDQEEISLEELENIEKEILGDDKYTFELQIINMLKNLK